MNRILGRVVVHILSICCLLASPVAISGAADAPQKLLDNLQLPCSIAIRPESGQPGEIFIADRGAGRVIRLNANQLDRPATAIAGFPVDSKNANAADALGIQSIYFLDHMRLVVAGGNVDGKFFIRLYELLDADTELHFDDQKQIAALPEESDASQPNIRSFHDIARTRANDRVADTLLLAGVNDDGPAGIWKLAIRASTIGTLERLEDNDELSQPKSVGGIAVAAAGFIAVATDLKNDNEQQPAVAFLNPATGATLLNVKTDSPRIVALAYQGSSGNLFAACATAKNKSADGIYRLDDASQPGKPACQAAKVAPIARPTALAFAPDGALYVTALGARGDDNATSGALVKIPAAALQP